MNYEEIDRKRREEIYNAVQVVMNMTLQDTTNLLVDLIFQNKSLADENRKLHKNIEEVEALKSGINLRVNQEDMYKEIKQRLGGNPDE